MNKIITILLTFISLLGNTQEIIDIYIIEFKLENEVYLMKQLTLYKDSTFILEEESFWDSKKNLITKGFFQLHADTLILHDSIFLTERSLYCEQDYVESISKDSIYLYFKDFFERPISNVVVEFVQFGSEYIQILSPNKKGQVKIGLEPIDYRYIDEPYKAHSLFMSFPNKENPNLQCSRSLKIDYNYLNCNYSLKNESIVHPRITKYLILKDKLIPINKWIYLDEYDTMEGSWGEMKKNIE